ncbi:MAG TPA: VacJ family lipoprotein [Xanthomonadaceae bacterium]|nr:VacJ family lipoprotein [Xanthomonadaceae bacterium]
MQRVHLPAVLLLLAALLPGCTHAPVRAGGDDAADRSQAAGVETGGRDRAQAQRPQTPDQLDPWEPFNRRVYGFNRGFDRAIFRPAARAYTNVVPSPVRKGISHFFDNLQQPVTALNLLLQGDGQMAASAGGRFVLNTTVGVLGFLDPATDAGVPVYQSDFGATFAHWGWDRSRYLMLPLFGPSTLRDGVGKLVNTRVSPVGVVSEEVGPGVTVIYAVDARARALPTDAFLEGVEDDYLLLRDAYLQRRRCQIHDCSEEIPDYEIPDYDFEVPDFRGN